MLGTYRSRVALGSLLVGITLAGCGDDRPAYLRQWKAANLEFYNASDPLPPPVRGAIRGGSNAARRATWIAMSYEEATRKLRGIRRRFSEVPAPASLRDLKEATLAVMDTTIQVNELQSVAVDPPEKQKARDKRLDTMIRTLFLRLARLEQIASREKVAVIPWEATESAIPDRRIGK